MGGRKSISNAQEDNTASATSLSSDAVIHSDEQGLKGEATILSKTRFLISASVTLL